VALERGGKKASAYGGRVENDDEVKKSMGEFKKSVGELKGMISAILADLNPTAC
jgi:hypothetical protein